MMLRIVATEGNETLARVFVAELDDGSFIEFAESIQPPVPRERKWVLIVSTLRGCPVSCSMCDAGGRYAGGLGTGEILAQIDFLVRRRYPDGAVPVPKFKIQFARMGDPVYNDAVLEVLRALPSLYDAPGLMPCISTIAPARRDRFYEALLAIKNALHAGGRFQMQFSIHTSCESARRKLIPAPTLTFAEMADYGERFFAPGDRRITLNFAPARGFPLDPACVAGLFPPRVFAVKLTPINPTGSAARAGLVGLVDPNDPATSERLAEAFRAVGFETILSIGDADENRIGSNCGMRADAERVRGATALTDAAR